MEPVPLETVSLRDSSGMQNSLLTEKEYTSYIVISSVASLPTICKIALSPPGWYWSHAFAFRTFLSKMRIWLPSAINPSISLRDRTLSRNDWALDDIV